MTILVQCPDCQKQYRLADKFAGRSAKCKCGTKISVPTGAFDDDPLFAETGGVASDPLADLDTATAGGPFGEPGPLDGGDPLTAPLSALQDSGGLLDAATPQDIATGGEMDDGWIGDEIDVPPPTAKPTVGQSHAADLLAGARRKVTAQEKAKPSGLEVYGEQVLTAGIFAAVATLSYYFFSALITLSLLSISLLYGVLLATYIPLGRHSVVHQWKYCSAMLFATGLMAIALVLGFTIPILIPLVLLAIAMLVNLAAVVIGVIFLTAVLRSRKRDGLFEAGMTLGLGLALGVSVLFFGPLSRIGQNLLLARASNILPLQHYRGIAATDDVQLPSLRGKVLVLDGSLRITRSPDGKTAQLTANPVEYSPAHRRLKRSMRAGGDEPFITYVVIGTDWFEYTPIEVRATGRTTNVGALVFYGDADHASFVYAGSIHRDPTGRTTVQSHTDRIAEWLKSLRHVEVTMESDATVSTLQQDAPAVSALAISKAGELLAVGHADGSVVILRTADSTQSALFANKSGESVAGIAFSGPENLVMIDRLGNLSLRAVRDGTAVAAGHLSAKPAAKLNLENVTLVVDNQRKLVSCDGAILSLEQLKPVTGEAISGRYTYSTRAIATVTGGATGKSGIPLTAAMANDGTGAVLAEAAVRIALTTGPSKQDTKLLCGHYREIRTLCFSASGERLLSTGDDGEIILWNVQAICL